MDAHAARCMRELFHPRRPLAAAVYWGDTAPSRRLAPHETPPVPASPLASARCAAWWGMPMRQRTSALGRLMLAGLFAAAPRLFVSIEVHGLTHDTGAPRTLFAITHKRDLDAFAPLPRLLGHRGWRALTSDVHFAMRADSFQAGFLARVVQHPGWFARLLRPISVGPVLRAVGVHPLDSLHFRPAETWLREALIAEGNVALGTLLAPDALASIAAAAGDDPAALAQRPLSALLALRYCRPLQQQLCFELVPRPAPPRCEARVLASAKRQVAELAAWLRAGGSVS